MGRQNDDHARRLIHFPLSRRAKFPMSQRPQGLTPDALPTAGVLPPSDLIRELTLPTGWSVPLSAIVEQPQIRLDAEHYNPRVTENAGLLRRVKFEMVPLSALADIRLPGRFSRIWAKDREHGAPYLNATDLMSYFATGQVAQERFLSRASNVPIESLLLHEGMILVTCSGTIGRVFDVPKALEGYAGTHDLVRITPHDGWMRGFIRAWLTTELAQTQILSHTHGGQIDHVSAEQIAACLVPVMPRALLEQAAALADEADALRGRGLVAMQSAADHLQRVVSNAQ